MAFARLWYDDHHNLTAYALCLLSAYTALTCSVISLTALLLRLQGAATVFVTHLWSFYRIDHLPIFCNFKAIFMISDTYRQAAIDLTQGKSVSEEILSARLKVTEEDLTEIVEKEENVKMLIEDAKKMLIVEPEECLGGWSLVNADPQ